jgi:hypothetical protein
MNCVDRHVVGIRLRYSSALRPDPQAHNPSILSADNSIDTLLMAVRHQPVCNAEDNAAQRGTTA